jgi:hypothetical protein
MSLTTDGVWKAGVWASTVWADGVWREGAAAVVSVPTDSLGANDRRFVRDTKRRRRVPTAEEVYRQAVNPPPPPLANVPALADIPGEVDREIAYRLRTTEADQLVDRVATQAARAAIERDMAAAAAADAEDEEAIFAIMTAVLLDEAA